MRVSARMFSAVLLPFLAAGAGAVGATPASATAGAAPASATMTTRQAAVPGLASAADSSTAVYLDRQGRTISRPGGTPYAVGAKTATAAATCTPYSGKDNPHYSTGDVSGHGWWDIGNCYGASTAHVYNCLYEFYTDNSWRQKACSPKWQLRPGGGSGNRTTARARCNPTSDYISWRNHVDVDVDGRSDTAEWPYNQANVVCVVF